MSVLQRQIEAQGLATVSISLYRDFTVRVQPPRALWVPFPFGRPMGAPNNKAIQRKVILAALALLSRPRGPVLEDLVLTPAEEPMDARNQTVGAKCGVKGCDFESATRSDADPAATPEEAVIARYDGELAAVLAELDLQRVNHSAYLARYHGRTQVGHSGHTVDSINEAALFIHRFVAGETVPIPEHSALAAHDGLTLELFIRLCADDLKTYFMESRLATGELDASDTGDFNEWFWFTTRTATLIKAARDRILESTDRVKDPYCVVARGMVPRGYGEDRYMTPGEPAGEAAPAIVLYHGDNCSACHAEMQFLTQNKVTYVRKNVSRDIQAREELVKLGSRTVPTTLVGGEVIVGFEINRLKHALRL